MEGWMIVSIFGVPLLAGSVVAWVASKQKQSEKLRCRSEPDYDPAVKTPASRERAETVLASCSKHEERFDFQPLSAGVHARRYHERPSGKARFSDTVSGEARNSDDLKERRVRPCRYAAGDIGQRRAGMSLGHSPFVDEEGEAREAALAVQRGVERADGVGRPACDYRSRFEELLETRERYKAR